MHYEVALMHDLGCFYYYTFFTIEEASELYHHTDCACKKLYACKMDGTRIIIDQYSRINRAFIKPFDYTGLISDIKAVPAKRVQITGKTAKVYLKDFTVYEYRLLERVNVWKLTDIYEEERKDA